MLRGIGGEDNCKSGYKNRCEENSYCSLGIASVGSFFFVLSEGLIDAVIMKVVDFRV